MSDAPAEPALKRASRSWRWLGMGLLLIAVASGIAYWKMRPDPVPDSTRPEPIDRSGEPADSYSGPPWFREATAETGIAFTYRNGEEADQFTILESLGGGVATRLAQDLSQRMTPPSGLILRSTFSSLTDAAANHFSWIPVRWLLIDRFPSEQRIRDVTCPVLQFHGRRDAIVPIKLGQKLFAAAPETSSNGLPKRFVELPRADHNDVIETSRREIVDELLEFFRTLKKEK